MVPGESGGHEKGRELKAGPPPQQVGEGATSV